MMQVSKKIPFEDPMVLNGVRLLYVVSNLIIFSVYYYMSLQIKKKKGSLVAHGNQERYTDANLQISLFSNILSQLRQAPEKSPSWYVLVTTRSDSSD